MSIWKLFFPLGSNDTTKLPVNSPLSKSGDSELIYSAKPLFDYASSCIMCHPQTCLSDVENLIDVLERKYGHGSSSLLDDALYDVVKNYDSLADACKKAPLLVANALGKLE